MRMPTVAEQPEGQDSFQDSAQHFALLCTLDGIFIRSKGRACLHPAINLAKCSTPNSELAQATTSIGKKLHPTHWWRVSALESSTTPSAARHCQGGKGQPGSTKLCQSAECQVLFTEVALVLRPSGQPSLG